MDILLTLIFIVGCAGLDFKRGDTNGWQGVSLKALYGLWVAGGIVLMGGGDWIIWLLCALGFAVGAIPGWGHPVGKALGGVNHRQPQSWQVGVLKEVKFALPARGVIWVAAFPFIHLVTPNPLLLWALPAMAIAFTVSPYIAKAIREKGWSQPGDNFDVTAVARGAIFGLLLSLP